MDKSTDQLPLWRCHKKVRAFKIGRIEYLSDMEPVPDDAPAATLRSVESNVGVRTVTGAYMTRHRPKVGGYYVVYLGDGYESYSPAEPFEAGYSAIVED